LAQNNAGEYNVKRALIESVLGGSNYFLTQGKATFFNIQQQPGVPAQQAIQNESMFEGWKYESINN